MSLSNPYRTENSFGVDPAKDKTHDFLLKYRDEPWVRGKHDCVMFIWKFTSEVYSKPFADPLKYPFHNLPTAIKAFKVICKNNGSDSFEGVLDKHYTREELPVEGGLIAKRDSEGVTGYSYGVCYNGFAYFVGESGLVVMEINPEKDLFWSVA